MNLIRNTILLVFIGALVGCGSGKRTYTKKRFNQPSGRTAKKEVVIGKEEKKEIIPLTPKKIERADAVLADLKRRKPNLNKSTLAYIEEYNDIAILEMINYDIPASITLAQGILESRSGLSRLSVKGNNHFGVKCHKSWTGKRMYHDDDARQECFRKYDHPLSSFRDHSLFLYGRTRYEKLFKLRLKDYKGWARGLKKAGYATDPKYPAKLIRLIEDYELNKYDDFKKDFKYSGQVAQVEPERQAKKHIVVKKGDTLYSLSKKHELSIDRLKWLNGLKSNELSVGQKLFVK